VCHHGQAFTSERLEPHSNSKRTNYFDKGSFVYDSSRSELLIDPIYGPIKYAELHHNSVSLLMKSTFNKKPLCAYLKSQNR
jgi:hypothetical protein